MTAISTIALTAAPFYHSWSLGCPCFRCGGTRHQSNATVLYSLRHAVILPPSCVAGSATYSMEDNARASFHAAMACRGLRNTRERGSEPCRITLALQSEGPSLFLCGVRLGGQHLPINGREGGTWPDSLLSVLSYRSITLGYNASRTPLCVSHWMTDAACTCLPLSGAV